MAQAARTKTIPVGGEWRQWGRGKAHLVVLADSGLQTPVCGVMPWGDSVKFEPPTNIPKASAAALRCKNCLRDEPLFRRTLGSLSSLAKGRYVQTEGWWWRVELEEGE